MFVDYTKIKVKAGNGGNGAMTFHREKYIDNGGPDGGDGGNGGSVIFRVHSGMNTLLNFNYNKKIEAKNGENGAKKNCTGKSAEDIYVDVPKGTVVRDLATGKIIADLKQQEESYEKRKGNNIDKYNYYSDRYNLRGFDREDVEMQFEDVTYQVPQKD